MKVVISGGTGFIGSELAALCAGDPTIECIQLLVRRHGALTENERFERLQKYWQRHRRWTSLQTGKIHTAAWSDPCADIGEVLFFHTAAATDFNLSLQEARTNNVVLTQRAIQRARSMPGLRRFVHFSTAFVCGQSQGVVREDDPRPTRFFNHYERSKWEAEQVVRHSGLPYLILRPSIVVGDSRSGYVLGQKVLYSLWRLWMTGVIPRAPFDRKASVDIVPVDFVTRAAKSLAFLEYANEQTVHLCSGISSPTAGEIFDRAASSFRLSRLPTISSRAARVLLWPPVRQIWARHQLQRVIAAVAADLPYLSRSNRVFCTKKWNDFSRDTRITCPTYDTYLDTLFAFVRDSQWGKKAVAHSPILLGQAPSSHASVGCFDLA